MRFIIIIVTILFTFSYASNIKISSINHTSKYENITLKITQEIVVQLSPIFDLYDNEINIALFNTNKPFKELTGLPNHIPGVMLSNKNLIYLKTPNLTGQTMEQYQRLIHHELIHLYHNQKISINLFPDWFIEGIAEYFSAGFDFQNKIALSKILLGQDLPDIFKLNNINKEYNHQTSVEYIFSESIVDFLVITYGEEIIAEIMNDMVLSKNFMASFSKATHLTLSQFNIYWKEFVKQKYGGLFLLDFQYILWLFIPFIFIFSLIVKLFQNQAIINKWKYEKLEEQINSIFTDTDFCTD